MKKFVMTYILLLVTSMTSTAALSAPAICNHAQKMNFTADQCLVAAKNAMKDTKFTGNVSVYKNAGVVFAVRGNYSAVIRCLNNVNMAFFVVAGESCSNETGQGYQQALSKNFKLK